MDNEKECKNQNDSNIRVKILPNNCFGNDIQNLAAERPVLQRLFIIYSYDESGLTSYSSISKNDILQSDGPLKMSKRARISSLFDFDIFSTYSDTVKARAEWMHKNREKTEIANPFISALFIIYEDQKLTKKEKIQKMVTIMKKQLTDDTDYYAQFKTLDKKDIVDVFLKSTFIQEKIDLGPSVALEKKLKNITDLKVIDEKTKLMNGNQGIKFSYKETQPAIFNKFHSSTQNLANDFLVTLQDDINKQKRLEELGVDGEDEVDVFCHITVGKCPIKQVLPEHEFFMSAIKAFMDAHVLKSIFKFKYIGICQILECLNLSYESCREYFYHVAPTCAGITIYDDDTIEIHKMSDYSSQHFKERIPPKFSDDLLESFRDHFERASGLKEVLNQGNEYRRQIREMEKEEESFANQYNTEYERDRFEEESNVSEGDYASMTVDELQAMVEIERADILEDLQPKKEEKKMTEKPKVNNEYSSYIVNRFKDISNEEHNYLSDKLEKHVTYVNESIDTLMVQTAILEIHNFMSIPVTHAVLCQDCNVFEKRGDKISRFTLPPILQFNAIMNTVDRIENHQDREARRARIIRLFQASDSIEKLERGNNKEWVITFKQ